VKNIPEDVQADVGGRWCELLGSTELLCVSVWRNLGGRHVS
jgi:hypothetical protein